MNSRQVRAIARLCKKTDIVWSSCISALLLFSTSVHAQQTADANAGTTETVVVSGSRLVTNGAQAPTPLTVVSAEQLQLAAPTNLLDGLFQMPVFPGSSGVLNQTTTTPR